MPTKDLDKETARALSKSAADSTLVCRRGGGGRQSMHWRAGQPFRWASTSWQKRHETQERKAQSPGTLQCRHCRVLGLGLGWLRRSSAGKGFQVEWNRHEQWAHVMADDHPLLIIIISSSSSIAPWPGQGEGFLLSAWHLWIHAWTTVFGSGNLSTERKAKNGESLTKGH